jgi:CO/xanthine dehydrogenase Mo-binding subunit
VLDPAEALKPGAPVVHEGGNVVGPAEVIQRGDEARGFQEADAVVEETYETSCEIHATMEPLSSVARWDGERLTVWESSQASGGFLAAQLYDCPNVRIRGPGHRSRRCRCSSGSPRGGADLD